MVEAKIKINSQTGLHARPASLLVKEANKFKSNICLVKHDKEYNAKSIMSVMSMGATFGDEIIIRASGEDENEALNSLKSIIEALKD
ncbi:phosphocarrier protein [Caloramator fervidus]|uniref:Phosphocarrier protein HPr n=1 Tax=Caloramator fervidus TaxID=29344 RepID=A0A1H5WT43_9CLOT|nr:HPr family phosphocarrier protein [Caloramator fervidus]SEG02440.1 phosphocarrier protein [Caloramator fervidus]